jgi:hypothetical protein
LPLCVQLENSTLLFVGTWASQSPSETSSRTHVDRRLCGTNRKYSLLSELLHILVMRARSSYLHAALNKAKRFCGTVNSVESRRVIRPWSAFSMFVWQQNYKDFRPRIAVQNDGHASEHNQRACIRESPQYPGLRQSLPNPPGNAIPLLGLTYTPRNSSEFSLSPPWGSGVVESAERSQEE